MVHAVARALDTRRVPRLALVHGAVPDGCRRSRSQATWLRAVEVAADEALLRADARRNVLAIAWTLARYADWEELTSRPTWALLEGQGHVARRTLARWLRWLRDHGLLGVVETGSTPDFRPMALAYLEGNRAAEYVLCEAGAPQVEPMVEGRLQPVADMSVDTTGTPPGFPPKVGCQNAGARARRNEAPLRGVAAATAANDKNSQDKNGDRTRWALWARANTQAERLELCHRLRAEASALRDPRLSIRALRSLLRPWLVAGWSARGILHALDHTPDGEPWPYVWKSSAELRNPAGWVTHRMRRWLDAAGAPLPCPLRTMEPGFRASTPLEAAPPPERRLALAYETPAAKASRAAARAALLLRRDTATTHARALERARAERAAQTRTPVPRPEGRRGDSV